MNNTSNSTKGHPAGLYVLFATEFWERFSYYGMRAIFTLFMVKMLFNGDKELASNIYGSYTGLVYLTPLIGGYMADRYWGNRKSIFVGGILMAIGQFFMFFSATVASGNQGLAVTLMWAGLTALIFGNGFFKPNISTMVGQLYKANDVRKDAAYTIFYMGINAGAFLAPLVCGFLGEKVDFKWGFLAAGFGMLLGLIIFYATKNKYVVDPDGKQLGVVPNKATLTTADDAEVDLAQAAKTTGGFSQRQLLILIGGIVSTFCLLFFVVKLDIWGSLIYGMTLVAPITILTDSSLTKVEKSRLGVIIIIMIFVIFFWMCFEQAGASLTFFADEQTNRNLFGSWVMPASFFQSFNPVFIILLAPLFATIWTRLGRKGFDLAAPYKQSMGLALLSLGFLFIALGTRSIPVAGASVIWLTGLYFIHTIGELFLSPIGLSMVNKLTPARFTSLMMGIWFLAIATGNKLAGYMSSLYPDPKSNRVPEIFGFKIDGLYTYFMVFVVFSGVAAILLFMVSPYLKKQMHGIK
jgi:POT family proton-dependent oligopeptide transporter